MVIDTVLIGALVVPSVGTDFPSVRRWMDEVWRAACPDAPAESGQAFVLSVHEALANVIEHGYADRRGPIEIEVRRTASTLLVTLTHDGQPFSGNAPPPNFDGTQDSGFGMYIMTRGLSRVIYGTTPEGRQRVQLIKRAHGPLSDALLFQESRTS